MMPKYEIIFGFLSKEEAADWASHFIENKTNHPFKGFYDFSFYSSSESRKYLDKLEELKMLSSEWFLKNYQIDNFRWDRSHGTLMFKGAKLPSHIDRYDPEYPENGPGNSWVSLLFLTDDYSGGDLVFEDTEHFHLTSGDVILFPGFLIKHGVEEVISGIRINLVTHFFGDPVNKVSNIQGSVGQ
jgi:hypothetical protein